ncbi:MAG: hypothetical protein VB081_00725 [Christensenella sp.]|uniref:hypothetical protein n=1 Tax=Christensenella sp. TaxID=1935934 RepID=UPI002B20CCE0|nr:hypothetical protein [Christensenella sp.]MEA5002013.1 hypothetical protein [Christensenella sp.]
MRNKKRASTLVMVLCVFGFIVIVGVSVMTLAGVANQQASHTLGQQQADFAAQSVLDTVSAKIVDQTIDPFTLGKGSSYKVEGSGSDDVFGEYDISIEKDSKGGIGNVFRVAVTAEKNGFISSMHKLLQYTSGEGEDEVDLAKIFDVVAGATNLNPGMSMVPSSVGSSTSEGSVFFDNGDNTTTFTGGSGVTKNVDAIGKLNLGVGTFGTQGEDTHVQANGDIEIKTSGAVYSDVRSEGNVTVDGSQNIPGDIYANGDVVLKNGAVVAGDVHAGGTVTLQGWGVKVKGTIYANGTRKDDGTFENGNVNITAGAAAEGDIYANGTVLVDGYDAVSKGTIYANGDVTVQNSATVNAIKSNANVVVNNSIYNGSVGSIECMGNVDVAGLVKSTIKAGGNGNFSGTFSGNIYVEGEVKVGNITGMKDVYSNTKVNFDSNTRIASSVYPNIYAPSIMGKDADISYCHLFAWGKPGIVELDNCIASAASNSLCTVIYANSDVNIKNAARSPYFTVVEIYARQDVNLTNATLTDSWAGTNLIRALGEVKMDGGKLAGSTVEVGGNINITNNATIMNNTQLFADRTINFENSLMQLGSIFANREVTLNGNTSIIGTTISSAGALTVNLSAGAQRSMATVKVNGAATFDHANFSSLTMDAISGASFTNSQVGGGTIRIPQGQSITKTDSSVPEPTYVIPPDVIEPVAPFTNTTFGEIPKGEGVQQTEKLDIPYDEMPMVDLKLQEKYANPTVWNVPAAIDEQMKQNNIDFAFNNKKPIGYEIAGNDYIFKNNCNLTIDFQKAQGQQYGKNLVFDATEADLYVRLKMPEGGGYTMEVTSGVNILTKGDHNVYLFLDEGTNASNFVNFALKGNTFMGHYDYAAAGPPAVDARVPNLYVISNAKGVVMDLSLYNSAHAFFYAPYGTVKMTGSSIFASGAKLYGSAIASHIEMGDNQKYIQYTSTGTSGGGGSAGVSGWTVVGTYPGTGE